MKKLLLILICLFVSFEVKSKEIVLVCKIIKKTYKEEDDNGKPPKEIPLDFDDIIPKIIYFDIKNEWLYDLQKEEFYMDKVNKEENIKYEFSEDDRLYISTMEIFKPIYKKKNDRTLQIQWSFLVG